MGVGGIGGAGRAGGGWGDLWDAPGSAPGAGGEAGDGSAGPAGAAPRPDLPDPQARRLLYEMEYKTSHDPLLPEWARVLDRAGNVRKLARAVLADDKVTAKETLDLVLAAEDYHDIRPVEMRALKRILDEHGPKFEPAARMALGEFLKRKRPNT